jgi:cyclomaltodextrinase / maltogenic alpha-amylase / neopullulanase
MLESTIFHSPNEIMYVSCIDRNSLSLTLKVPKKGISSCSVYFSDRFVFNELKCVKMRSAAKGKIFDHYNAVITDASKRFKYFFETVYNGETYYYTSKGLSNYFPENIVGNTYFQYPYINANDLYDIPEWAGKAVFYQIFPDRFFRDRSVTVSETILRKWEDAPSVNSIYGGNIDGITDKLDHLTDLGVNCIYLSPIFRSSTYHRYDVTDYYEIDPMLGNKDSFKRLVDVCHKNNIRIILDGVFNHTSNEFFAFADVVSNKERSKYKDWFYINDYAENDDPAISYETFALNIPVMPRLNTSNKEVIEYFAKVSEYWIKEFDIDGWRLDVADEVDHEFWREFRKRSKRAKNDIILIGEVWYDATNWLKGDMFDSVMNYPLRELCLDLFIRKKIDAAGFNKELADLMIKYPDKINKNLLNLMGSHDTSRILTLAGNDADTVRMLYSFMMTFPGIPMVYYGDEIGILGNDDYDCRKTMMWDKADWDNDLYGYFRSFISLRREYAAFSEGDLRQLDYSDDMILYMRTCGDEKMYVFINISEKIKTIDFERIEDLNCIKLDIERMICCFPYENTVIGSCVLLPGRSCMVLKNEHCG